MRRSSLTWFLLFAVAWSTHDRLGQDGSQATAENTDAGDTDTARLVLTFYYPWYGNPGSPSGSGRWSHWEGVNEVAKRIGTSTHYPRLGPYDSYAPDVIAEHIKWAKQAGIDGFIISWWGHGSFSDDAMPRLLDACADADMKLTIYYETVPSPQTAAVVAEDIQGVLERYGSHRAWLKVDGKPVLFIYGRAVEEIGLSGWAQAAARVNKQHQPGVLLIGDRMSPAAACIFDGLHTYNTCGALKGRTHEDVRAWARQTYPDWVSIADSAGRISTITVIPGYDDTKIRTPGIKVERFDGGLYRAQWEEAIAADPHWVLITSFNEWHEGSEIEPSAEYGERYLDLTGEMAGSFKAHPKRRVAQTYLSPITDEQRRTLSTQLSRVGIAVLPRPDSYAYLWLERLGARPTVLTWEQIVEGDLTPQCFPILLCASGEHYRQNLHAPGDVDDAIKRYLRAGGVLVALPAGPVPFYYNEQGATTHSGPKLGLDLGVGTDAKGWEMPPTGHRFQFEADRTALPHVSARFEFPSAGDQRWRPFRHDRVDAADVYAPLLRLRDETGDHWGDGACFVEYRTGDLHGGRILYAWFALLEQPEVEVLVFDLFTFLLQKMKL